MMEEKGENEPPPPPLSSQCEDLIQFSANDTHTLQDEEEIELIKLSSSSENEEKKEEEKKDPSSSSNGFNFFSKGKFPVCLSSWNSIPDSNYFRGCKWSPDGLCVLTNSEDNYLRLFEIPREPPIEKKEMAPILKMKEAECIYDFAWYPLMDSSKPETCCLVSTSRYQPIHLFDAYDGHLRATYRCYDKVDEVCAANSLAFDPLGRYLYVGLKGYLRVFDVSRPGRDSLFRKTVHSNNKDRQTGIISTIDVNPSMSKIYACGSYDRTSAIYAEPEGDMLQLCEGQKGGITQVSFSPDGLKLITGARKDEEMLVWDLRKPGELLCVLNRSVATNQKINFTCINNLVISGDTSGSLKVWDLNKPSVDIHNESILPHLYIYQNIHNSNDAINGASIHPSLPILATTSGQRHFPTLDSDPNSPHTFSKVSTSSIDNSLKIWNIS